MYACRTQMTFVLIRTGLLLEGSNPKIEDKQVPGILIYYIHIKLLPMVVTAIGKGDRCHITPPEN